jgi:hypothetical protein
MKGDIAFVGFMLTADEWQALDSQSRAQLIAVATRRADPVLDPPRRFPDGTGKHEIVESIDDELEQLIELDLLDADLEPIDDGTAAALAAELAHKDGTSAALEAELARLDRDGGVALFADDAITFDATAEYDALEEWLALQPDHEYIDHDEWVTLPPALPYAPCVDTDTYESFSDWDF